LQDASKFTQIGIFGLKICHLATLLLQEGQAYLGIVSYAGYSLERIAHRATLEASKRKQSFKFFGTENHVSLKLTIKFYYIRYVDVDGMKSLFSLSSIHR
jgi:hypothetical protein